MSLEAPNNYVPPADESGSEEVPAPQPVTQDEKLAAKFPTPNTTSGRKLIIGPDGIAHSAGSYLETGELHQNLREGI